jgi:acylphosphatase
MNMKKVHIFVTGRVQGVVFRWWTKRQADKLWLAGWVRNLKDGRVEIVAEGERKNLQEFIKNIKAGPALAKVEKIEVEWGNRSGGQSEFEIIH